MRLAELTEQWRGLCQYVQSPCKQNGCTDYFEWTDWQEWIVPFACEKLKMYVMVQCIYLYLILWDL